MAWGAYFFDEKNYLYGLKDDTDVLAPFPMSTIHSNATPYSTSSAKSTMTVKFCHEDARAAIERADYVKLDFNPQRATLGLTAVKLVKTGDTGNDFKLLESIGTLTVSGSAVPKLKAPKTLLEAGIEGIEEV